MSDLRSLPSSSRAHLEHVLDSVPLYSSAVQDVLNLLNSHENTPLVSVWPATREILKVSTLRF